MLRALVLAVCAALLAAAPARAGFNLQITDAAGNPTAAFTTGVGGTVTLGVYLVETGGSVLATDGLFSAGVALTYGTPGVAGVAGPSAISPNPLFTNLSPAASFDAAGAGFSGDVDLGDALTPTAGRIFLGTVMLTGLAPGTTTLAARDRFLAPFDDFLTGSGTAIDGGLAFGSANLTVTGPTVSAVPVPATGLAAAVAAGLLSAAGRRFAGRSSGRVRPIARAWTPGTRRG